MIWSQRFGNTIKRHWRRSVHQHNNMEQMTMSYSTFHLLGIALSVFVWTIICWLGRKNGEEFRESDLTLTYGAALILSWLFLVALVYVFLRDKIRDLHSYLFQRSWRFTVNDAFTNHELYSYKANNWFDMKYQLFKIKIQLYLSKIFN
jgi:hypothetical protein